MMLTVITDDFACDLSQIQYVTLIEQGRGEIRTNNGVTLIVTDEVAKAVIAKLKPANKTADKPFKPMYTCCDNEVLREWWINRKNIFASDIDSVSSGFSSEEMARKHRLEGQETVHLREVKKDEIDPDEYKYAIEACGVPVEEWVAAKDCKLGVFYQNDLSEKLFCVAESSPTRYAQFVCSDGLEKVYLTSDPDDAKMKLADVQSW